MDTSADPGLGAQRGEALEFAVLLLLERLAPTERLMRRLTSPLRLSRAAPLGEQQRGIGEREHRGARIERRRKQMIMHELIRVVAAILDREQAEVCVALRTQPTTARHRSTLCPP